MDHQLKTKKTLAETQKRKWKIDFCIKAVLHTVRFCQVGLDLNIFASSWFNTFCKLYLCRCLFNVDMFKVAVV